ncbi:MAG TPA: universal stress protein [Candidatus Accumulibacter phosphatis]|nr:MAG: putative universal stress protein [Candidatus Accumulibacter sp. SK-11]HAY26995.1 universal stress protein [Accumulibacter sp.]HRL77314.1 universal stress protein [Candidatus Accumulibacter phosphatis]HCN68288.1 universal stress protein [Accumulibacter sp.]HCV12757.1 universal stress protein [Accumulibacter sp.]
MYKRIMAAVDQSFMTSQVMQVAIEMARTNGAQLAICHAVDETLLAQREVAMMLPNSVGKTEARMRLGAQGFLDRLLQDARAAGIDAETKLVESEEKHVSDMLIEAAVDWQADLLVVGTHGRRGIERFFVGSVAERLVRKGQTSLLLVRGEETEA